MSSPTIPSELAVHPPTSEQAAAIDARDRDVFCEAGAGTGKTRVLVGRYCDALTNGEAGWTRSSLSRSRSEPRPSFASGSAASSLGARALPSTRETTTAQPSSGSWRARPSAPG